MSQIIKVPKDGNCVLSAFALGLCDNILMGNFDIEHTSADIQNKLFTLFDIQDSSTPNERWKALTDKIKTLKMHNQSVSFEKSLIQTLRDQAIDLFQKNSCNDKESLFNVLASAFDEHRNGKKDNAFRDHRFIIQKFEEIQKNGSDEKEKEKDLQDWWEEKEGLNEYWNELKKPGIYLSDTELTLLAQHYGIEVAYKNAASEKEKIFLYELTKTPTLDNDSSLKDDSSNGSILDTSSLYSDNSSASGVDEETASVISNEESRIPTMTLLYDKKIRHYEYEALTNSEFLKHLQSTQKKSKEKNSSLESPCTIQTQPDRWLDLKTLQAALQEVCAKGEIPGIQKDSVKFEEKSKTSFSFSYQKEGETSKTSHIEVSKLANGGYAFKSEDTSEAQLKIMVKATILSMKALKLSAKDSIFEVITKDEKAKNFMIKLFHQEGCSVKVDGQIKNPPKKEIPSSNSTTQESKESEKNKEQEAVEHATVSINPNKNP